MKLKTMDFKALDKFLTDLSKNNNKDWFDANRPTYEQLRKDWIAFTGDLLSGISIFDNGLAGLEPSKCIFRINKDVRFSKDKSPYKTNFGSIMNAGGKKELTSGYYFHFSPGEIFIAGGSYQPTPELLAGIRQEIDYHTDEFLKIVNHKSVKKYFGKLSGDALSRPPKGYDANHEAIEYIKMKSFILVRNFTLKDTLQPAFMKELMESYQAIKPLNDFLNRCL